MIMRMVKSAPVLMFLFAASAAFALPRTIHVPGDFGTIQEAINDCNDGDTVIVAEGTYTGAGNKNLDFLGKAIALLSTRPDDPAVVSNTVIDCQNSGRAFNFHSGEDANSIVSGFTITGGSTYQNGAGIYCTGASPSILNCAVTNNYAENCGGGIYCASNSNPVIINCTVSGNTAKGPNGFDFGVPGGPGYGGGIYGSLDSHLTIEDCTITGNTASGGVAFGGVVPPAPADGNAYGGGIYGSATINNCIISENTAAGGYSEGGTSRAFGGGIYGIVEIMNSKITGNTSVAEGGEPPFFPLPGWFVCACGGGVFSVGDSSVTNCLIAQNQAYKYPESVGVGDNLGGGLCADPQAEVDIRNCTIVTNTASGDYWEVEGLGGGIYSNSITTVANSILWANAADSGTQIHGPGPVSYSDVQGGRTGEGNINADPLFTNPAGNDYHLEAGSPCINVGDNNAVPPSVVTDLDGNPRIIDGTVDMGAYESPVLTYELTVIVTGGYGVVEPNGGFYPPGTVVTLTTTPGEGYRLAQWTGTDYDSSLCLTNTVTMNGDRFVMVELEESHHRILYVGGGPEYTTIQDAIDDAREGDIVVISTGTYPGNILLRGANITLTSTVPDDPMIVAATIIKGTAGDRPAVTLTGCENETCVLDGLTIADGNTAGNGGGISGNGAQATISNCVIRNNHADDRGGGISDCDGSIRNCTITDNSAVYGGGMSSNNGTVNLANCTFTSNSADWTGGGVHCLESDLQIENSTFAGNSSYHGAGLYGMHSVGQVSACTFRGNTADYNDPAGGPQLGCGGGLYCFAGDIMVLDCVITENTARGSGGGGHLLGPGGTPELINCLVANNTAGENGGGVCCAWYAESIISNCTIADNLASTGYGGGLLCSLGGNTIVTNCVIWENSAASGGPQIGVITDDYYPLPSTLAVSYCDVEGGQSAAHVDADCTLCTLNWGAGNIDTDPLFADPAGNDYHLEPGSPCINVGDNNAVPPSVVTDLDGNPRIIDGTVDMGAYELPRILYVDADASGANDGSSWEDAFTNLHDAIQAAGYGSEVWVAQATYKPTNRRYSGEPRSVAFNLKDGVMVYGGFNGTETSQSQRDPNRYETILSGDLDNDGLDADNAWHVVEADTEDVGPTGGIDGFTVTGGYADGQSPENNGGGIYIQHESPTVANCKIMCNYASMSGGGVYSNCGDPTLTNCAFIGNAAAQGGGIACWSGSPTLTNCMFGGNSASGDGGGIACADSNVTVTNCTCAQNSAFVKGGAIFGGIDGNLTMTNSIVWDNSAEFGPQIYLFGGSLAATYSNIQGGYAGEGNIDADPQFVDANNGDYHLGAGSPCVDVGDNSAVPSSVLTDMDGNPRIINGVVDLGPYETIFFYVDGINGNDGNNGRSPETAFATIQRGINSAQDGCVVLVYPAVYLDPDPNVWESIDFLGKNIKLTSANPADWNTVGNTVIAGSVFFSGSEDPNCTLTGFTIRHLACGAIYGNHTRATISHCILSGNAPCGAIVMEYCDGTISNCLITDNFTIFLCGAYPVVFGCHGLIKNCTIANNSTNIGVLDGGTTTIDNCIIYANGDPNDPNTSQIGIASGGTLNISYSNVEGGLTGIYNDGEVNWGPGNIDIDPCFVRLGYWQVGAWFCQLFDGDYHLMSEGWRWDADIGRWTYDDVTSRSIDAGNPGSPLGDELMSVPSDPNNEWAINLRVNMGTYGGTAEASLAPHGWALRCDLNNDGTTNRLDLKALVEDWLRSGSELPGDLSHDDLVNGIDFALLAGEWEQTTEWFRFVDLRGYWPFGIGHLWDSEAVPDAGYTLTITDRFFVNGFEIWEFTNWYGSIWGGAEVVSYYVYVDGILYATEDLFDLDRLPDIAATMRAEYLQFIPIGVPVHFPFLGPGTVRQGPLHSVLAGTGFTTDDFPLGYRPDVICFVSQDGQRVIVFARDLGPMRLDAYSDFGPQELFIVNVVLQDLTPPTPDPMQWDLSLDANGLDGRPREIHRPPYTPFDYWAVMRADPNTTDDSGSFEFYFECTTSSGFSSGWISLPQGPPYEYAVKVGLSMQEHVFRVRARDSFGNMTAWSEALPAVPRSPVDTTPPAPPPLMLSMQFSPPNSMTMTASDACDVSGVEYYFKCISGGGNDSGWQDETLYIDANLAPDTQYCYGVKARDKSANHNETGWSNVRCIILVQGPPTPDPMQWDETLDANGFAGIPHEVLRAPYTPFDYWAVMRADPNTTDDSGSFEFYFECTTRSEFSSGWISLPQGPPYEYAVHVELSGLEHVFRIRARDPQGNMTAWSTEEWTRW